jgi:hypothetical protein
LIPASFMEIILMLCGKFKLHQRRNQYRNYHYET